MIDELLRHAVQLYIFRAVEANFIRLKFLNAVAYTIIPVIHRVTVAVGAQFNFTQLTAAHIHHAVWLKSIPV